MRTKVYVSPLLAGIQSEVAAHLHLGHAYSRHRKVAMMGSRDGSLNFSDMIYFTSAGILLAKTGQRAKLNISRRWFTFLPQCGALREWQQTFGNNVTIYHKFSQYL